MTTNNNSKKALLITGALLVGSCLHAALSPVGGEYPILGDTPGHQQKPSAAVGASGGFIVWQNATATSGGERILAQRLGADMAAAGVSFRVSQAAVGRDEENPKVALLKNGGAVVVWEGGSRSSKDIYVRFLMSEGGFASSDAVANTYTAGIQSQPAVAVLEGGNVVVLWTSAGQDGSGTGVYGQIFSAAGAKIGGEFLVNQTTSKNQSSPAAVQLAGGGFAAGWVSESVTGRTAVGAPNLRGNVSGRIFGATGQAAGNEFAMNGADAICSEPTLGSSPSGGFTMAWAQRDEKVLKNQGDIYARSFSAAGVPLGEAARHNVNLVGAQRSPGVQMLGDSGLVVWAGPEITGAGQGIQGRMLSGGSEFRVNSQTSYHQKDPLVIGAGSEYIAVWVNTIKPSHSILSAQRYSLGAGAIDLTAGVSQPAAISASSAQQVSLGVVREAQQRSATYAAQQAAALARAESARVAAASATAPTVSSTQAAAAAIRAAAASSVASAAATTTAPSATTARATTAQAAAAKAAATKAAATKTAASKVAATRAAATKAAADRVAATKVAAAKIAAKKVAATKVAATKVASAKSAASAVAASKTAAVRGSAGARAVAAAPVTASLTQSAAGTQLQWGSDAGKNYQIQSSANRAVWRNVGSVRAGTGGTDSMQVDTSGSNPYYRVVRTN